MKSTYQFIREAWKKPKENIPQLYRNRLIQWRREPATLRINRPTRIDRARALGYQAKQGFILVRQRVSKGGHYRATIRAGRKGKHFGRRLALRKNYQLIAEERSQKQFPNLAVLNSYWVGGDGQHQWYEIIFVDPCHPVIRSDKKINWVCQKKQWKRVFHGKTSAGRKMRGLRHKGKGAEKMRPSRRAHQRRG